MKKHADIIVAGHICLDLIPSFRNSAGSGQQSLIPGTLTHTGKVVTSTGGAVANVGLALTRLGVDVRLIGRIGDDPFGRMIIDIIEKQLKKHAHDFHIAKSENTSYTIVLNPPGQDRLFLHCPGANDTFTHRDISVSKLKNARIFHLGYPPLMRSLYSDDGRQLLFIMKKARSAGLVTTLDTASVDPASDAGRANWRVIFQKALPAVDIFLPSYDELLYMLKREEWRRQQKQYGQCRITTQLLHELSSMILALGPAIVAIKIGKYGLYLRSTTDVRKIKKIKNKLPINTEQWLGHESITPCYTVKVAGTTGSGDCTIAGFLAALLRGESPADAAKAAVATGSCSVEQLDATSGVQHWSKIHKRIKKGWPHDRTHIEPA